jgi:hypothetical protein
MTYYLMAPAFALSIRCSPFQHGLVAEMRRPFHVGVPAKRTPRAARVRARKCSSGIMRPVRFCFQPFRFPHVRMKEFCLALSQEPGHRLNRFY